MNSKTETLTPAAQLARDNPVRVPNESAEYRAARTALLAEEIELRRQLERVAAHRRALPPGGPVQGDYRFQTEDGPSDFAGLFGDKQIHLATAIIHEVTEFHTRDGKTKGGNVPLIGLSENSPGGKLCGKYDLKIVNPEAVQTEMFVGQDEPKRPA